MSEADHPASPCVRNCCLNDNDLCLGCMRTLQEILDWHQMSATEKHQLLAALPARKDRAPQPPALRPTRTFFGLPIPSPLREQLSEHVAALRRNLQGNDWRWIAPDNYHLTLAFLGNQQENRLQSLQRAFAQQRWLHAPLPLEVSSLSGFPDSRRSRLIVAHVHLTTQLAMLVEAMNKRLAELGFPVETRTLRPHISLARSKRKGAGCPVAEQKLEFAPVEIEQVLLYASETGPQGPYYRPLAAFR